MFRDQFPNFRYEVAWDIHYGLGRFNTSFVFRKRFVFRLLGVVGKHPLHFALIPSLRKSVLAH